MAIDLNFEIDRGGDFGGAAINFKDSAGAPFPLAGWSALAQVRKDFSSHVILDLAPIILADDSAGIVTIPPLSWLITAGLPGGTFRWDLTLIDPAGRRYPKKIIGSFRIDRPITQTPTGFQSQPTPSPMIQNTLEIIAAPNLDTLPPVGVIQIYFDVASGAISARDHLGAVTPLMSRSNITAECGGALSVKNPDDNANMMQIGVGTLTLFNEHGTTVAVHPEVQGDIMIGPEYPDNYTALMYLQVGDLYFDTTRHVCTAVQPA